MINNEPKCENDKLSWLLTQWKHSYVILIDILAKKIAGSVFNKCDHKNMECYADGDGEIKALSNQQSASTTYKNI